jgi:sulfonate transport system substrate-binding protein
LKIIQTAALCAALVVSGAALAAPVKMAELSIAYSALSRIAAILGFIDSEKADVEILPVLMGPDAVGQLRSPAGAQLATIAVTPVVTMIGAGADPVVLATTLTSKRQVQLVTFEHTGITDDPKTLRGKRIGRVRNTVGEIYLTRLLERSGLRQSDVELVHASPSDLVNLLVRSDLHAAVLWDPFPVHVKRRYGQSGKNELDVRVFIDESLYTLAFNIVSTKAKLRGNEESVKRLLLALLKAEGHFRKEPHDAQIKLEGWLGLSMGDLDHFMRTTNFRVELDQSRMERWLVEEMTWLKSVDTVKHAPLNMAPYIDASFLRAVAPDRVR